MSMGQSRNQMNHLKIFWIFHYLWTIVFKQIKENRAYSHQTSVAVVSFVIKATIIPVTCFFVIYNSFPAGSTNVIGTAIWNIIEEIS